MIASAQGDHAEAEAHWEQSLAIYRALRERATLAWVLNCLGVVDGLRHVLPCREAVKLADVAISERTAYRVLKVVRTRGEEGLTDGRLGHSYKLTAPIQEWLVKYCGGAPGSPDRVVQAKIE